MRYKRKKAFTILECMLYLSISMSICILGIGLLTEARSIHYKFIKENLESNTVDEGVMTIDEISKEGCIILADSNENTISFNKQIKNNEYLIKVIRRDLNSIVIKYYSSDGSNGLSFKTTNELIADIDDFIVIKKGKLVYFKIIKKGKTYLKCL